MSLHKLIMGKHEDRSTWIAAIIVCLVMAFAAFMWGMYCMIYVNPIMLSLFLGLGGTFAVTGYAGVGLSQQLLHSYEGE